MNRNLIHWLLPLLIGLLGGHALAATWSIGHVDSAVGVKLVVSGTTADVYVDPHDFKLASIAAGLLCDDVNRVSGLKPNLKHEAAELGRQAVIVGTIGHSALIDQLAAAGKISIAPIAGKWETYAIQVVDHPLPNVESALVIAGSDRRATAYGVFDLSQAIGVSPWYWWADVTPVHQDTLIINTGAAIEGPPSVKYRGIFINDEDWGLEPWAAKTFEPEQGNIGPKTYAKVFELILRLRGNYLWPAMHPVSTEFARIPANITLADDWGIVMGASHTEAMNRNNVLWPKEGTGPWRYDTNRANLLAYWEAWAKLRGQYEAVWTLGIRGVHDSAMLGPPDPDEKKKIVENAINDQRDLLKKYVSPDLTKVPQLFAPYKEVLALYQRGMKVPDDVTILWTDDNFGYIRQLSTPTEQKRQGASGIYYHISYLGSPRSYTWLNTTPPALIWEEMTKAYDYGADRIWVCNVGDIKPGEIGMDFWLRLAWNVHAYDNHTVGNYLTDWATREFGAEQAPAIASVMSEYYRLGFIRKPETMDTNSFDASEAARRIAQFDSLTQQADAINDQLPAEKKNAFYELVLYPVRICDLVSHVYLAPDHEAALNKIGSETDYYNTKLASGKWHQMMTEKGTTLSSFAFKWPRNIAAPSTQTAAQPTEDCYCVAAEHFARNMARNGAQWQTITGLGRTANAVAVFPTTTASITDPAQIPTQSPELDYDFTTTNSGPYQVGVYAIPTHRINAMRGLRYAVAIDNEPPQIIDFDQSSSNNSKAWQEDVIRNTNLTSTTHTIAAAGNHTLKIFMVDPGVVLEKFIVHLGDLPPSDLGPPETLAPLQK